MDDYDVSEVIDAQLDMAIESADDIGDFSDEGGDLSAESETQEAQATDTNSTPEAPATSNNTGGESQQVTGTEQPQGEAAQSAAADGHAKPDGKGNLVDAQGNIVAERGPERRVYEQAQKIRHENGMLQQQMQAMQA